MGQHEHPWLAQLAAGGYYEAPVRSANGHPVAPAGPPGPTGPGYLAKALDAECAQVAATPEGSRNHALNTAAFRIGQLLHLGGPAAAEATHALRTAGLASGLGPAEVDATVASGLAAGQAEPRIVELYAELPDTTISGLAVLAAVVPPVVEPVEPVESAESAKSADQPPAEPAEEDAERAAALAAFHERCVEEAVRKLTVRADARRLYVARQRPPQLDPELATLADLTGRTWPAQRWRIENWLPARSRCLLAAQYKAGKTTLVTNLIRCLVDGEPWLRRHEVTPIDGTVAVIDVEMNPQHITAWLSDQHIAHEDSVWIGALRGKAATFDLLDPATRTDWANRFRARQVAFLIVDCLRPLLDALGLDEHHDAGQFLVALDALLAEAGIPDALLVHHMGHGEERSRGDSRLRDWPDVEWNLVRENDDPASPRYIKAFGRDVDFGETQLTYDPVTRHLGLAGGNRADAAARSALFDVLAVLRESSQPLSRNQVEMELAESDHTRNAVRGALRLGVRLGSIVATPGPRRAVLHSLAP